MLRCKILRLFCVFSFLPFFSASAADITLITMQTPPYGYIGEDGVKAGLFYEINEKIMQASQLEGAHVMLPRVRLTHAMQSEEASCTILANTNNARQKYLMLEPLGFDFHIGVIANPGITLQSYADLKGLRIGVVNGTRFGTEFDTDENLSKVGTSDYRQGVVMLQKGRLDVMAGMIESLRNLSKELDPNSLENMPEPLVFKDVPIFLVCQKDQPDQQLFEKLKKAVSDLREAGEIEALRQKYLN